MKYKSIFDMSYSEEERKYPDCGDQSAEKFRRILRTFSTDIVDPQPSELVPADSNAVDSLMKRVRQKRSRIYILRRPLIAGLAASVAIAISIVLAVSLSSGKKELQWDRKSDFITAFARRDTGTMLNIAESMKAKETPSAGAPDYRTILSAAAYLAIQQNNRASLNRIASLSPEILRGAKTGSTRGSGTAERSYLPELVKVDLTAVAALPPGQYPLWSSDIAVFYPQISRPEAEKLARRINTALFGMDSVELARCGVFLAQYKANVDTDPHFTARTLFEMGWDTAVSLQDVQALNEIAQIYKTSPLYQDKQYGIMKTETKYLSSAADKESSSLADEFNRVRNWIKEQK